MHVVSTWLRTGVVDILAIQCVCCRSISACEPWHFSIGKNAPILSSFEFDERPKYLKLKENGFTFRNIMNVIVFLSIRIFDHISGTVMMIRLGQK
jgi:hypothetical protein